MGWFDCTDKQGVEGAYAIVQGEFRVACMVQSTPHHAEIEEFPYKVWDSLKCIPNLLYQDKHAQLELLTFYVRANSVKIHETTNHFRYTLLVAFTVQSSLLTHRVQAH